MPRAPGIDRAPAGVESGYCCRSLSGSPAKVRRFGAACATDTVLEHQAHRPLPKVRTYTVGPLRKASTPPGPPGVTDLPFPVGQQARTVSKPVPRPDSSWGRPSPVWRAHNALDVGPETGQMLSTYIVETGQPLSTLTR